METQEQICTSNDRDGVPRPAGIGKPKGIGKPACSGRTAADRRRLGTRRCLAGLVLAMVLVVLSVTPVAADWSYPIDAPVVDPFRAPAHRYGAGNRGLEYGNSAGKVVVAVDAGRVGFVGLVAGRRVVVIHHASDLRSTYTSLGSATVVRGQRVAGGQQIGIAAAGFHLSARLGDSYVDPELLFAGAEVVIELTASELAANFGQGPEGESGGGGGSAIFYVMSRVNMNSAVNFTLRTGTVAKEWHKSDCTSVGGGSVLDVSGSPIDLRQTGNGRILIQVGGLGTETSDSSIGELDAESMGYDSAEVIGFSYAGGCTTSPFGDRETAPGSLGDDIAQGPLGASDYQDKDTYQSVETSAARLANLVEQAAILRPGKPIDIAAHSLGGVVTRRALEILDERRSSGNGVPGAMPSLVTTIASPHQGAELALGAGILTDPLAGGLVPALAPDWLESDVMHDLSLAGGSESPDPPPEGVSVLAIGGDLDMYVPAISSVWEGAENVIVFTEDGEYATHSGLPGHSAVAEEMALAIAGAPPRCVGLGDVVTATVLSSAIGLAERGLGMAISFGRWGL